jgi:ribose transport system permease protein
MSGTLEVVPGVARTGAVGRLWDRVRSVSWLGLLALLLALWLAAAFLVPRFATGDNILNVLRQSSDLIVAAIGIMFVLLIGGIDMSIGSLYGLTSVVLVSAITRSGNAVVGVTVALVVAVVIGLVNGWVVEKIKVPAFITTLGMSYIALALAQMLSAGGALRVPKDSPFQFLTQANLFGIPLLIIVAAVVAAVAWYALEHTSFGRSVSAVGYNREASRLAGVRVGAVTVSCYVAASLLVAVGAILLTSRIQTGEPTLGGANTTFEVITAAVVGGTSLFGGKGNVIGVLIGAIIIRTIGNCITLLNVTPLLYQAVMGSLILVALTVEALRHRYARSDT